ncbi:GNAT family N-acetyltransferase [Tenacibaculum sp. 1B UA]|uniref:GNAT family N-acetyltransferase n=1 Tax=unclassified Tenacibaculum TaxID=2635139 RepID=UPI0026E2C847|nr:MULTISPECIES: GNAT family N-acetyltransferase [unclassified Tenacibaculum]MDO6675240.1 GNAT family N-acetyltransferase [Tenacibaculum sp. 1_MG-2023]MDX8553677.1 GNAT family N-acetyltransferase [Tenacibaculum sp. 1B UA]
MIVKAQIQDADLLTEIALSSKAHWGYSKDQIEKWKNELTVTSKMFAICNIYKFQVNDITAGFYVLHRANIRTSFLDFLFISPNFINQGIGSKLLEHAKDYCRRESCAVLNVLSDPNSESFYLKHGFKVIDKRKSSIKGRFLPEMELYFPENM